MAAKRRGAGGVKQRQNKPAAVRAGTPTPASAKNSAAAPKLVAAEANGTPPAPVSPPPVHSISDAPTPNISPNPMDIAILGNPNRNSPRHSASATAPSAAPNTAPPAPQAATSADAPVPAPAPAPPSSPTAIPPLPDPAQAPAASEAAQLQALNPQPATPEAPKSEPAPSDLPPLLFEVAWEVCWQLGGIYTVLKTKAASMVERWNERYCLVGPYNPAAAGIEFEEQRPDPLIRDALDRLRAIGIEARFGRWLVAGRPRTILLDHRSRYGRIHEDKYLMWKDHSISTPADDGEVNDVVAFGFAAAELFRILTELAPGRPIIGHFHEWMGGVAVPRIAHLQIPVATVFTTHATLLGRYLASDNPHFYQHLAFMDADKEAQNFNIYARYSIEKAAAHAATVFTTVSDVTALEAEKLLGRAPDGILPNGLNIERFTAMHEFQNLHRQYKETIHDFVRGHFFPAYEFDIDNTLYFFTAGRYEYRNKGFDLFIEAMARLNWRMKAERHANPEYKPPTIVAFLVTRAQTRNINVSVLQSQTMFEDLKHTINSIKESLGPVMLNAAAYGRFPTAGELFGEESKIRWKRAVGAWKNGRTPSIVTHDLMDDQKDPVLIHLRHRALFNGKDDLVKMIFHPDFMTATSPLVHLDYEHFIRGCHMGVFPSYYEPWGYTPMESIALGVPAITSDLAGFGAYVKTHVPDAAENGVLCVNRRNRSFDDACNDIVDYLYEFTKMSRRQRIEQRNKVERLGDRFDWSQLVRHYHDAHAEALQRLAVKPGKIEIRMV